MWLPKHLGWLPYSYGFKTGFFSFQNNTKNYLILKIDLNFWDCFRSQKKSHLIAEYNEYAEGGKKGFYSQINMYKKVSILGHLI